MGSYSNAFSEGVKMADQFSGSSPPVPVAPIQQKTISQQKTNPIVGSISKPVLNTTPKSLSQPIGTTIKPTDSSQHFMGGGLLSKAFDLMQLPYYAIAGGVKSGVEEAKKRGIFQDAPIKHLGDVPGVLGAALKGMPAGVENRTQYGNEKQDFNLAKEAGVNDPTAQAGVNLVASLTAPNLALGKIVKSIPGVSKLTSAVGSKVAPILEGVNKFAKETPQIAKVVEKFNPFFRNPELGNIVKATEEQVAKRQSQVINMVESAAKGLKPEEQKTVGKILEGIVVDDPTGKYEKIAQPIRELSDAIGKEAVDLGLLDPASYEKFKGKYMSHIWEQMGKGGEKVNFGSNIIPKEAGKFFKQRTGKEGYIQEFSPAVLKGLGTEVRDVEVAKMYKQISEKFGQEAGSYLEPGRSFAPSSILGSKAGKVLRTRDLPESVVSAMKATMTPQKRGIFDKAYDLWKKGKTIYNPGYHVRNLASNQILSDMSTEAGLPKTIVNYVKSVGQYRGGGDQSFVNAAKESGLIGRKTLGGAFDEAMNVSGYGKKQNILQKIDKGLTGFQNASEETAKINVFTSWVKKEAKRLGKTVQDALKDENIIKTAKDKAEEAIFSPYNINKTERGIASKITPFYSFTRQATPFVTKTALNRPGTLTKYEKAKKAIEELSPDRAGEYTPDYAKDQIRLPAKDKEGRSYYANPQYIYPWGGLNEDVGGNLGKAKLPLGLSLPPQVTMPIEALSNKSLYYGTPITKSSSKTKQLNDYLSYFKRGLGPTLLSSADKLKSAITGEEDWAGRKRNIPAAIADVAGLKTSSFVPSEQQSFDMGDRNKKIKEMNKEISKWKKSNDPNRNQYIQDLQKEILNLQK